MSEPNYGTEAIGKYCSKPGISMSARPEFYSGRGVICSDLGPNHLQAIYNGLKEDFGQEATRQFCLMIEDLTDLSATNFLNQFYVFFNNGRRWCKKTVKESGIDIGSDDGTGTREAITMVSVIGVLSGRQSSREEILDASNRLKRAFFQLIGYTPKILEKIQLRRSSNACERGDY